MGRGWRHRRNQTLIYRPQNIVTAFDRAELFADVKYIKPSWEGFYEVNYWSAGTRIHLAEPPG